MIAGDAPEAPAFAGQNGCLMFTSDMDAAVLRENALLKARLAEVEAALAESQEANRRLEDILRTSQRAQFGKRSEKLSPDQFNLPLEDAELAQDMLAAAQEKA